MKNKALVGLIIAVITLTGARLWLAGHTELLPEEAYYWMYGEHLAFGYFDHPPMVGWTIEAGTELIGDNERGVRAINILLWACSCFILWLTARRWFGERVAVWASWLFVLLPIFLGVGFVVTPDGLLVFFWMLTLYALTRALHSLRTWCWFLAGAAFGGALLSKYYAVLLAPSLFMFLLISPRYRFWLRRWQPWAALALGLLIFSPVIFWNAQHEWASFAYQSTRTVGQKGGVLAKVGQFWLLQLAVLTPLGLVLYAAAAVHAVKRGWLGRDDAWNFAASFSLPLFALFVAASVKTDVHINWTAPAFLSLSMPAAALFLVGANQTQTVRRRLWRIGVGVMCVTGLTLGILGHVILATGKPKLLAYSRTGGWRELARRVERTRDALANETGAEPFIIGADKYNIAAEMGFYLQRPDECVNLLVVGGKGMSYRYWTDLRDFEGRPAVAVIFDRRERTLADLREHFDRVEVPAVAPVGTHGKKGQRVALVNCYGYREARP